MLRTSRHGDIIQLEMSCRQSRLLGFSVNAYLVRGVLIDSGFPRAGPELVQFLDPARLRGAMITHKHEDHAGNVAVLATRGIPIAIAAETRRSVESPQPIGLYRRWTWGSPRPLDVSLVPFAPGDLELVPTPGHSSEHHVVWDAAEGDVFGGDLFIGVKVRIAHPGEDIRGSAASLRRIIALGPRRLFDGHRGLVPDAIGALSAKLQWIEDTVGVIEQRHRAGAGETEILKAVFGREAVTGYVSKGDYSRRNFVRSVVSTMA
ncbi:MAG: MBL fold metallo-hydrolase [Gemmatimonadaceae bacterium]